FDSLLFNFFLLSEPATPQISTLSLHDALPISTTAPRRSPGIRADSETARSSRPWNFRFGITGRGSRCLRPMSNRSTLPTGSRNRSEEHTSELQSLAYLVCRLLLEKKKINVHRS